MLGKLVGDDNAFGKLVDWIKNIFSRGRDRFRDQSNKHKIKQTLKLVFTSLQNARITYENT